MGTPTVFDWATTSLFVAAALGLTGWLALRRGQPGFAHTCYLLALVKLITPPLVGIGVWASDATALVTSGVTRGGASAGAANLTPTAGPDSSAAVHAFAPFDWAALATTLWLVGALVAALLSVARQLRLQRHIAALPIAAGCIRADVSRLATALDLRKPPTTRVTPASVSPFVCWTTRGVQLVLPAGLLAKLSTASLDALLTHELAHVRRRDYAVRYLERAALCAWWWMPLTHWLARQLRRAEELCCDRDAIRALPDHGHALGAAITTTLTTSRGSGTARPRATLTCPMTAFDDCKERLQMLTRPIPTLPRRAIRLTAALALATLTLPFVACGSQATPPLHIDGEFATRSTPSAATTPLLNPGDRIPTDKTTIELGDIVRCSVPESALNLIGAALLRDLQEPQRIGEAGTIFVPYIGSVSVLGLSADEATAKLNAKYDEVLAFSVDLRVRVSSYD